MVILLKLLNFLSEIAINIEFILLSLSWALNAMLKYFLNLTMMDKLFLFIELDAF